MNLQSSLIDTQGNVVYPDTASNHVYHNGERLDRKIEQMEADKLKFNYISVSTPTITANTDAGFDISPHFPPDLNQLIAFMPIGWAPSASWDTELIPMRIESNTVMIAHAKGNVTQMYFLNGYLIYK